MVKGIAVKGRPLAQLAHPLAWLAAAVLLFNVYFLQLRSPSWISGKLGDLAWLVLAPLLASALFDLLFPIPWKKAAGPTGFLLTTLFFCLVKLAPPVNHAVNQVFIYLSGSPAKLSLDPTDLLALPGLALAGWIWSHPPKRQPLTRRALGLAIASLALLADAAPPQHMGFTCVRNEEYRLVAYEKVLYQGDASFNVYTSDDLGQSWKMEAALPKENSTPTPGQKPYQALFGTCVDRYENWSVENPSNPETKFFFLLSQGVYLSPDNGETLLKQFELPTGVGIHESVLLPDKTLVLAAGLRGIFLLPPEGDWKWIPEFEITGRGVPKTTE